MTIKVKTNSLRSKQKGYFFKGLKGIFMPFKPANPYTPN